MFPKLMKNEVFIMSKTILQVTDLKKSFKSVQAVKNFSISISAGEIVALLGPNGAGKTTAINCLTTLVSPDSVGFISVDGFDVTRNIKKARRSIGLCPQHLNLYEGSTVKENLELQAYYAGYPKKLLKDRVYYLLDVVDLVDKKNSFVKTLSGGMQRRLQIARALLTEPKLILLDEPTIGLSPETRQNIWTHIRKLKSLGYAILLTTHYMEEADQLADRIFVMDNGSIIAEGTPEELKQRFMKDTTIFIRSENNFEQLVQLLDVKNFSFKSLNNYSVMINNMEGKLSSLLKELEGIEMDEFTMKKPNLEDVFLALTGNSFSSSSVKPPVEVA